MDPQQLAQILSAHQLLPGADLEQALQRQVVQGAGLDTNMLELGQVTEAQMLSALGQAFGLPVADRAAIDASPPTLTQSFPLMFAETYHLVPHRLEGDTLHVLSQGPLDQKLAQRIQERVHLQLVAHVTCEVRLHYAMHRLYGTQLLPRFVTLLRSLDGEAPGQVLDEATQHTGGAEPRLGWGVSNARVNPVRAQGMGGLTRHDVRSQVARLDAAQDRDTIVDIVLGFALALFDYAGLFVVQGGRVQGWRGIEPKSTRQLASFDIALSEPSVFHTVAQTRGHYLGPISQQTGNVALLGHLSRPWPQVALVAPIVVGGKVAAILYADNQARVIGPKKVAALLVVVQRSGLCFEQLIRRRKVAQAQAREDAQNAPVAPDEGLAPLGPEALLAAQTLLATEQAGAESRADEDAAVSQIVTDLSSDAPETVFEPIAEAASAQTDAEDAGGAPPSAQTPDLDARTLALADSESLETTSTAPTPAAPSSSAPSAYSIGWQDVIDEAMRAQSLTPARFAAITVMDTAVDRRDLLFDGLEADDPAARQSAVAGLLALGTSIDLELSQRFPGPFGLDPLRTLPKDLPPFARLNGLTELIAARGQDAAALVLPHLDSDAPVHRWAAVYFLSCVHYPQACEALARRLYDTEPRIRTLAVDALAHYRAEAAYQRIISGLREQLRVPVIETQIAAIQILGQLREPSAVPALIPLVVTPNALVARSAASALAVVCGQAYGSDLSGWQTWWQSNYTRPRTHWLMGGLSHTNSTIRRVAHGELQRLTGQMLPFKSDATADEQARLLEAWQSSLLPHDAP